MNNLHDALTSYVYNLATISPSGGAANAQTDYNRGYCTATETIAKVLESLLEQYKPPKSDYDRYRIKDVIKRLIDCMEEQYVMVEIELLDEIRRVEKY